MDRPYNIGFIGAGMMTRQHMGHLQNLTRSRLAWVAGRDPGRLEGVRRDFGVPRATTDYREMLADPELDAVYITTPPHLHADMFAEVIRAGKHVLLEKPMAIRMEDVDRIVALHRDHPGVVAMECSGRHARLNPKFRMVKDIVSSGRLGEVYRIHHAHVTRQSRPGIEFHPAAKWFLDKSLAGGGPLFDWGVYDLSFHFGILDDRPRLEEIESVVLKRGLDDADPGTGVWDVEEHLMVHLRLSDGIRYDWERGVNAHVEVPNQTRVYGTRGGLSFSYYSYEDPRITLYDLDAAGKARKQVLEVDMSGHPHDGYVLSDHFLRVLDGLEEPVIGLETARKHMEILCGCRMFAENS
ncbi:MAG: Gfo/Idh/MocA family oxidoreductase [Bacteroidales bacterium]